MDKNYLYRYVRNCSYPIVKEQIFLLIPGVHSNVGVFRSLLLLAIAPTFTSALIGPFPQMFPVREPHASQFFISHDQFSYNF